MGLFKYINMPAFIISLVIGFFIVYITMPDTKKIYVHKTDTCFSLEQTEVKCPSDTKNIINIPIQG